MPERTPMLHRVRRLRRTTLFRLSLLYAVGFSLLVAVTLGGVYWLTSKYNNEQIDADLALESRQMVGMAEHRGLDSMISTLNDRGRSGIFHGRYYLLIDAHDKPLAGNLLFWPWQLSRVPGLHRFSAQVNAIPKDARIQDEDVQIRAMVSMLPNDHRLLIGEALSEEDSFTDYMGFLLSWALILITASALAGGVWMGRSVLRRIDAINETAGEIMAGRLSRRIPILGKGDEFDDLSAKLNDMLARIDELVCGMRTVSDNVAHDLRSPLTRLRNRLEVTLLEERSTEEYRRVLEQATCDADRLLGTFNTLLAIAQAEAGVRRSHIEPVDLSALCYDLTEFYTVAAEEAGIDLTADVQPGVVVDGSRDLIIQALSNVLENALKYVPAGGLVRVSLETSEDGVDLIVTDNGPGIPEPDDRRTVLERFVRLDTARSSPGNGLGLSLVRAAMQFHNGRVELSDASPGLRVTLHFPTRMRVSGD